MKFTVSLDRWATSVTIFISLFFLLIAIGAIYALKDSLNLITIVTVLFLISLYVVCFLYSPRSYSISNGDVCIHRYIGDVILHKQDIVNVTSIDSALLDGTIRTFGVGGLFGYFGRFRNKTIGNMTWFATRTERAILIKTQNKENIVLTPDDPKAFLAGFLSSIGE